MRQNKHITKVAVIRIPTCPLVHPNSHSMRTRGVYDAHSAKTTGGRFYEKIHVMVNEGMFKKILQTIHDKLEKEGGAAGYDDLKQAVQKEFGLDISKDTLKNMPGVRQHNS